MKQPSFHRRTRVALASLVAAFVLPAQADLILNSSLTVVNDGHVFATFLGYSASYSNDLFLQSPSGPSGIIFNNKTTPVGTTVDLGYFTAGTEVTREVHLIPRLFVSRIVGPRARGRRPSPDGDLPHVL